MDRKKLGDSGSLGPRDSEKSIIIDVKKKKIFLILCCFFSINCA